MKVTAAPLLALVVGLALIAVNASAPRMLNDNWDSTVKEGDTAAYYSAYDRNVDPRALRFDFGLGLTSLGASLLALIALTRTWTVARLVSLNSPKHRWVLFALANAAWLVFVWAEMRFLGVQQRRGEFAPWADSIGIPIAGLSVMGLLGLLAINSGLAFYLHRAPLPVPMWAPPKTTGSWILSGVAAVALMMCLMVICDAVPSGNALVIPAAVASAYLLLVGRAAACAV